MASSDAIALYGFTAFPRDVSELLPAPDKALNTPTATTVSETPIPSTALAARIQSYARSHLSEPTFNHSMRVYHYGVAIREQQFPGWPWTSETQETYFLSCMLHDIGTTPENLRKTRLSFEFYGGLLSLDIVQGTGEEGAGAQKDAVGPKEQAESVAETIIRHQDIGKSGKITAVGLLIQLATIFDNMGNHAFLVHENTIRDVVSKFPRKKWSTCFAATIHEENSLKPWAHTTALGEEDFPNGVLANKLMEPYE